MENSVKISLKIGDLDVSCEASEEFVSKQLSILINDIIDLEIPNLVPASAAGSSSAQVDGLPASSPPVPSKLSTTDFAVKMGVKSGSDLVMAAAAYLHHTAGSEEFRRQDILNQMKSAKAFYKTSYGSNLSKSLEMLIKSGRLANPSSETFALPYSEITYMQKLL
ncbi:hypothetical protein SAMN04488515_0418 [Cognatiyoonia koreensis]|uniref:Uncharacterized protein n=1 Tax=Cognatiyoonia koreensis TaxID=364200 RepID=A0A1I0N681_9RHOB|nr:hypothetical protein [Cognatiyoonia koreensis]SEV96157.1 hypothetical protein SAMN04488515_0418 [Cognatiyoonia koreensis]